MKLRPIFWSLVSLLCLAGAWFFWQQGNRWTAERNAAAPQASAATAPASGVVPSAPSATNAPQVSAASTNRLAFRLANTSKTISELQGDRHAILLENAFIDTSAKLDLKIPTHLQATGDPGAYLVQSRGPINAAFRATLAAAGAQIVSYIPNDAFLVRLSAAGAGTLAGDATVQAVLPYEPYYKVQSSLLGLAVNQEPLPPGTYLTLGLYADSAAATEAQIQQLGGIILSQEPSPFGQMVRVSPPPDWLSVVNLTGVQLVEPAHLRKLANDLARPTLGVSVDSVTTTNWMNLSGSNVLVEVNDTGIDASHPDLVNRVFGSAADILDMNGHGTHVAGVLAGDGTESLTVTNASGSIMPGTNGQFRGKAPAAKLFSMNYNQSDEVLQQAAALTNALISNNSWVYGGDNQYDLSAASYDAAVRDALPGRTGPQPVLFVFPAGNDGGGDTSGQEGIGDTILSPGTAKDVITVGALEQLRNLTNIVTQLDGTSNTLWAAETDSGDQVADYSSRGNVGVQTEGAAGRFKPDVIAPGSFVISTRSRQWDEAAYYNPTNYHYLTFYNQEVTTNTYAYGSVLVPQNAVGVNIYVVPNALSPVPFPPNMTIYASAFGYPDPTDPATYDFVTSNDKVSIPPDNGGLIGGIADLQNSGLLFAVGDGTNIPVNFDILTEVITTNDYGNELEVLSNLNNSIGSGPPYYYRYESGTSIATPSVSGVLALMQDFFTNTLHTTSSPALLKAMLINGARVAGNYRYAVTNTVNLQGWGVPKIYNSIPLGLTNSPVATNGLPMFFVDQSPTNALATGDSRTYSVKVTPGAQAQPLRITLAWTDPPGNPAAAIKLVNNLDVVVTNLDNPANPAVYYANNFTASGSPPFTVPSATNSAPVLDYVNNVRNIFIPPTLGTNYTVTVIGRSVNVNAVTLVQTNVTQDFALVISTGEGDTTAGIQVAALTAAPVPSFSPNITYIIATNGIYFDQTAGASAPLLSTNGVVMGSPLGYGTNVLDQVGQTNQWHFYVVTNTFAVTNSAFTNAAFITFIPNTLALPREGVFAGTDANSTRPEADVDLYVADSQTDPLGAPGLLNLSPTVISNCVYGQLGDGASLTQGGTEFVAYSNSVANDVYYIGVQSQDQTAGQYGLIAVFSDKPFSSMQNGNEIVNGVPLPANIPDGNNAHPGVSYVFGLALTPMDIRRVIVTNTFSHQNFGDLVGALSHSGAYTVLNSHDGFGPVTFTNLIYDDSGQGDIIGSRTSDGPGSLRNFTGTQAIGPWLLNVVDDSIGNTGSISGFQMLIQPHQDPRQDITAVVGPMQWFYTYVDVPVGYYNMTVLATNITTPLAPLPIAMYIKEGAQPTFADTNYYAALTNCLTGIFPGGTDAGNFISVGPPLIPDRYFIGLYNSNTVAQTVYLIANLAFDARAIKTANYASTDTPLPILDDAVTTDSIFVTNTDTIQEFNVGLRVDHPRISDLVFTLINPYGGRYLLMENRGGTTTNGCGVTVVSTNSFAPVTASGGPAPETNYLNLGQTSGTLSITYNFYYAPDQMVVYYSTNLIPGNLLYDTGLTNNGPLGGPYTPATFTVNYAPNSFGSSTYLTIVMNPNGNTNGTTQWTYTAGSIQTNYLYLNFTSDTNLTITPIKFAVPPFVPTGFISTNFILSDFETAPVGDYIAPATFTDESTWTVLSNQVSVVSDPTNAYAGSNFLALANGVISNSIPTVPGAQYSVTFAYRGPGAVSYWSADNTLADPIGGNTGTFVGSAGYGPGYVGSNSFSFSAVNVPDKVFLPDPPNLMLTNSLTIETWLYALQYPTPSGNVSEIFQRGDNRGCLDPYYLAMNSDGTLRLHVENNSPTNSCGFNLQTTTPVPLNTWVHVAATLDGNTGSMMLFVNGNMAAQTYTPIRPFGNLIPSDNPGVAIGNLEQNSSGLWQCFHGYIDDLTVYQRPLSFSEVRAIYQAGKAGKLDPALSLPQALAEASVTIPGSATNVLVGNNTNWQFQTITFTATGPTTPLVISGIEPGMLLDQFSVAGYATNSLNYLPEQPLDPLIGTNAYGNWQLEVLDNRAGATNPAPTLVSWDLQFTFANLSFNPTNGYIILTNRVPYTNAMPVAPNGGVVFYQVNVPLNADWATNRLLFADAPLNVWWTTNVPPTVGQPNDFLGIANATSGSFLMGTNTTPQLIPGTTYYLGVENTNSFAVTNYAVEVDFHLIGLSYAYTEPATLVTGTNAQFNGMATPNGYASTAWFEWGTNTLYGNSTPPVGVGNGFNVVFTSAQISGLITNTPYHCRLVVSNILGTVYGFDQILDEAYVVGWGADYVGQINVPTNLVNATAIAGAYDHSLALSTNALITAWGDNSFGQSTVPAYVSNVVAVAGGQYYSMALNSSGAIAAWGTGILNATNVPAALTNVMVVEIAGGTYSSLALANDGTVTAWGASFFGLTNVPANVTNTVALSGGAYHSLALKNDGTVTAWGDDSAGQTNVPPNATNVVAIAAGSYHNLALRYDGTLVAWGDNSSGQTNIPPNATNIVAIAAGGFHNLALKNDGTVVTWGDNSSGQSLVPLGLTNVVAIAAGYLHSLALTPQLLNLTNPVVTLTDGSPVTNTIFGGGIIYYQVDVPTNADFATNSLLFALNGQLNVWYVTNTPARLSVTNATALLTGVTNGVAIIGTNTFPALVPGSTYYLGVQNPNSFAVTCGVEVDFHLVTSTNTGPLTNTVPITGIIYTNIGGTNGYLLTWFAPSNELFQVQFTTNLFPANWITFTNIVSYNPNVFTSPTNTQFNFFDDGTQYPFGPTRFYRLILLGSAANPLTLPVQTNLTVAVSSLVTVTNTATDSNAGALLTYSLVNPPVNASISTNGIITWTNASPAGLAARFNTKVTDNAVPSATATNTFTVFVTPLPSITNVTVTATNVFLSWSAPTNDLFHVRSTTNLVPPVVWTTFPGIITSTNGVFSFTDTNLPLVIKFYQLILLP